MAWVPPPDRRQCIASLLVPTASVSLPSMIGILEDTGLSLPLAKRRGLYFVEGY